MPSMPAPLLSPPEPDRIHDRDDGRGGAGGPGSGSPRGGLPGRRPLATLLVASALLGGGASVGILAAAGLLGGRQTTTIVRSPSATSEISASPAGTSGTALNAESLYAATAAGVVDITARGVSSPAGQASPFGGPAPQEQSTATGSGFVIDGEGHILTASHVVDGASSITVTLESGQTRRATLLGKDDATDVAVLKIDPSGLTLHPLGLGRSSSLDVGAAVAAIGSPFGYEHSISTGIVSGLDRTIQAPNGYTVAHAIQTDAALNPGNSGGPVLDGSGEVVGIADQIATNGSVDQSSGVGFAVPIDLVRAELGRLEAGRSVEHAYLGVSTSSSDTGAAGALVGQVAPGGPAAKAGLRVGDVVAKIGDAEIRGSNDLVAAVAAHAPGDTVQVTVTRGSGTTTVTVRLGTQPTQRSSGG